MNHRLATPQAWSKQLVEEGVEVEEQALRRRLSRIGAKGKDARGFTGEILRGVLFTEREVRKACRDLLKKKK